MYLILLYKDDPLYQHTPNGCYQSSFTDDQEKMLKCLKDDATVYKLDSLTKIEKIKLTEETTNE
jgi:hypothetical protein